MPLIRLRSPLQARLARSFALAVAVTAVSAVPANAQTAAQMYERAQGREREALAVSAPAPDTLRSVATAYEAIVRRFPVSGYADNALWQAAVLLHRAFEQGGDAKDRDKAAQLLSWLKREYPHSPLATQSLPTAPARAASPAAPTGPASLRSVTRSTLPRGERITIELSDEVSYTGERVGNPDRVFFDFTNVTAALSLAEQARQIQSPLIKTVRIGSPVKGVTRVVLELVGAPRFSTFPLYGPFRLVVDVEPDLANAPAVATASTSAPATVPGPAAPAPAATTPPVASRTPAVNPPAPPPTPPPAATPAPPASTRSGDYSLARQLGLRVARIVIDPGHGGHDPGAQANGITEAELVLDVALRLEKLLQQQPGVEVVLTRRTNEFVPLEERTAIANREVADLFLSIHANAHRQTAVRGIETYFLNFATNPEAEAVAARENATSVQTMGTLPAIVKAIALNNKLAESREFASLLQTALVRRLRSHSSATKDLGVKQAPFVVLIGATMPSVLTEIAFLTNRPEASLLKQPAYRQQIAQALKDAVVRYQDSLKKVTTLAGKDQ